MSGKINNYRECLHIRKEDRSSDQEFTIGGFQEVILSVRDLKKASESYTFLGAYNELLNQKVDKSNLIFWDLPEAATADQILLYNDEDQKGLIRLMSFNGVAQRHIRDSAQSWDTGGIYDLDIRALNMEKSYEEFQKEGWTAYSSPMEYHFEQFHVAEVLLHGPEDVVVALIQRFAPKLEGYNKLEKLSNVFNSSQIVADLDKARDFYINTLGFKIYMDLNLQGSDKDENLFGVPQNIYQKIERQILIVSPSGSNIGSVELVCLKGLQGRDFSMHANPPNLGIMSLRFPVHNLEAFKKHLMSENVEIINDGVIDIPPYGKCRCLSIQSPEGAWLEFVEPVNEND